MLRIALVVFAVAFLHTALLAWWDAYKARKSREPIPMKLKNGVHVPWGPVQRIERLTNGLFWIWLAYMAALLVALVYVKLTG